MIDPARAPLRDAPMLAVDLDIVRRDDGTILLRSRIPLAPYEPCLPRVLAQRARAHPERPYLVQRHGPDRQWHAHTYAATKRDADAIAQWLIDRGVPRSRPVLILSANSIAHALMKLGGMTAGVPSCPVSVTYGLLESAWARLRHVVQLVQPAVVFVEDARPFARALASIDFGDAVIVTATPDAAPASSVAWDDVLATRATSMVDDRLAALCADDHAAYMLTSGSTGMPKAVIQTYGMHAANAAQAQQTLGEATGWGDVTMDWLPWSHVTGAAAKFVALAAGGTLYIDEGKPMGSLFAETLRNLREVPSAYHVNVPIGYALLADALEADADLRRTFFRSLRLMLYGGAGLPQSVYDRLQRMAVDTVGQRIMLSSAYGSTETTAGCLCIHFPADKVGIGLPMPGVRVKLVPVDERYEVRIAGPIVTPGYLNDPEKTRASLDEEGFWKLGDLAVFHDIDNPAQGLAFAGRLAEEFKLGTGTWTSGSRLRAALIQALTPWITEAVICGEGHADIGALAWPDRAAIERDLHVGAGVDLDGPEGEPLRAAIRERLARHNAANPGASTRIARFALLKVPPSIANGELSDKGTVNRNAVLKQRAAEVQRLYADPPPAGVIAL